MWKKGGEESGTGKEGAKWWRPQARMKEPSAKRNLSSSFTIPWSVLHSWCKALLHALLLHHHQPWAYLRYHLNFRLHMMWTVMHDCGRVLICFSSFYFWLFHPHAGPHSRGIKGGNGANDYVEMTHTPLSRKKLRVTPRWKMSRAGISIFAMHISYPSIWERACASSRQAGPMTNKDFWNVIQYGSLLVCFLCLTILTNTCISKEEMLNLY